MILAKGWINRVRATFSDDRVHMATGSSKPRYFGDVPVWLDQFWVNLKDDCKALYQLSHLDLGLKTQDICPTLVWGLNFGIRRRTLFALGGFHPYGVPWKLRKYRGDGEIGLGVAAKSQNLKAVYNPGTAVEHLVPQSRLTLEYFEDRAFLEGISNSYTNKRMQHGLYSKNNEENGKNDPIEATPLGSPKYTHWI